MKRRRHIWTWSKGVKFFTRYAELIKKVPSVEYPSKYSVYTTLAHEFGITVEAARSAVSKNRQMLLTIASVLLSEQPDKEGKQCSSSHLKV